MAVTTTYSLAAIQGQIVANGYETHDQFGSEVVGLSNGGYAVVYGSALAGNPFPLVTFYDADFVRISNFTIPYADGSINMVGDPEIIELSNGNVAVIWDSAADGDVLGAIINPNTGAVVHSEFIVDIFAVDGDPEATLLANGNWIVAMSSGSQIYMQIMDNTGTQVGGQISTGVGSQDVDPAITALNDGGWVVTYTDADNGGLNDVIIGKVYNADGTVRKADFVIGASGENTASAVAALNNGGFAVVYDDTGWGPDGISLHIFDAAGTDVSGFIRVDQGLVNVVNSDPDITVLDNGFIVVSWTDPGGAGNILGRLFDQNGTPIMVDGTTNPFVITSTVTADTNASISAIMNGVFVNTWTDTNPDADGDSISSEVNEITSTLTSDGAGDLMQGTALREFFFGNGGNDTMNGASGNDFMDGGLGADTMAGGGGHDEMHGGASGDTMNGGGGLDEMHGGGGDDFMGGQNGIDMMFGDAGADRLFGGNGNDTLYGGADRDRLYGQNNHDTLFGEGDVDVLFGGGGVDTLNGGGSGDRLFGQDGSDKLNGQSGNDFLFGGNGNDTLNGGSGNDRLRGEAGQDKFFFADNYAQDRINDFEDDVDTIVINDNLYGGGLNVAQVLATFGTQVNANVYQLDFGGGDILTVFSSTGVTAGDLLNDMAIV
ncbi:MAG: hypothetical protein HKN11_10990 [Rhizobiales bacterium]|nr:hypothetical protein [Hyphomicrobiales bacterium]